MNPALRKKLTLVYEIMLPVLAIFSLITLVALGGRYFHPDRQPMALYVGDHIIWAVFAADFFIRLCFAPSLRYFIAAHISEFVSIIPVYPFIFLLYLMELAHFSLLAYILMQAIFLIKFAAYLGRCYAMQSRFFKTNLLHYAGGITIVSLVISALLFSMFEHIKYGEALWFSVVTMTTTGYGDIVPHTDAGRLVASFMMIAGVACITSFTSILASRILSAPGRINAHNPHIEAIERQIRRFALLTEDEVEEMCIVLRELKKHQKLSHTMMAEDILKFNHHEEDVKWHSMPFIRWVRKKCRNFMGDSEAIEKMLSERKEKDNG